MYVPGIEVEAEWPGQPGARVVNVVRGLGEFGYVSPVARGWMEQALKMAGAKEVSVEELKFNAGEVASNELVYEMDWL